MSNHAHNAHHRNEHWVTSKWRPCLGWLYLVVCGFDFMVAPVLWSILNIFTRGSTAQWTPLTLQGAGLFHISMGAILGISAYGRTQEKINNATMPGFNLSGLSTMPQSPVSNNSFGGFSPPASTGFGAPVAAANSGFSATANSTGFNTAFSPPTSSTTQTTPATAGFSAPVVVNSSGKKVVPTTTDPEL
jgi:hypothetical protein